MEDQPKPKIILAKNLQSSPKFGDNLVEGAICMEVLNEESVRKLVYEYNGKHYLNVKIVKRKEVTKFDKTHYLEIDQFVPRPVEGI